MITRLVYQSSLALLLVAPALHGARGCPPLARRVYDNYLGDGTVGGFYAPRYAHHALHISLSALTAVGVSATMHWRATPSAVAGAVAIGVLPHARGLAARRYPLDRRDFVADVTIASEPLLGTLTMAQPSWRRRVIGVVAMAATYYVAACWSSP